MRGRTGWGRAARPSPPPPPPPTSRHSLATRYDAVGNIQDVKHSRKRNDESCFLHDCLNCRRVRQRCRTALPTGCAASGRPTPSPGGRPTAPAPMTTCSASSLKCVRGRTCAGRCRVSGWRQASRITPARAASSARDILETSTTQQILFAPLALEDILDIKKRTKILHCILYMY